MTAAQKRVDKAFRVHGATRHTRDTEGVRYMFPDGAVRLVPHNTRDALAANLIRWADERYGRKAAEPLSWAPTVKQPPTISADRIRSSVHALERIDEMTADGDLNRSEIARALLSPERVRWSEEHGSYVWEHGRIAVAAYVTDDRWAVIKTVLWTRSSLWAAHPRKERR